MCERPILTDFINFRNPSGKDSRRDESIHRSENLIEGNGRVGRTRGGGGGSGETEESKFQRILENLKRLTGFDPSKIPGNDDENG